MIASPRSSARPGLSLLEVLTALTIFLLALVGLGQLLSVAGQRALDVQDQSEATRLCQSKLAEVAAGVIPMEPQADVPFEEDPAWLWSLDCSQTDGLAGLWRVQLLVYRQRPDGARVEAALSQMVLDPALRGSNQDHMAPTATDTGTTGQAGSSGAPTTGTGQAQGAGAPMQGGGRTGAGAAPAPAPAPTPAPSPGGGFRPGGGSPGGGRGSPRGGS